MGSDSTTKGKHTRTRLIRKCCICLILGISSLLLIYYLLEYLAPSSMLIENTILPRSRVMAERILAETHLRFDNILQWCHFSVLPTLYLLSNPGSLFIMWELTSCETMKPFPQASSIVTTTLFVESLTTNTKVTSFLIHCTKNDEVRYTFTKYSMNTHGPANWKNTVYMNGYENGVGGVKGRCEVIVPDDRNGQSSVYRVALYNLPIGQYRYKIQATNLKLKRIEQSRMETKWYHYTNTNDGPSINKGPSNGPSIQKKGSMKTVYTDNDDDDIDTFIAVVADVQSGAAVFRSIVKEIVSLHKKQSIDLLVHMGDAIQSVNNQMEWHSYMFGPMEEEGHLSQQVPIIFARGNHDMDGW